MRGAVCREQLKLQICGLLGSAQCISAVQWWSDVGRFAVVDLAGAEEQLRPGCRLKEIPFEEFADDLRQLSGQYSFRHKVMLRWI